jgi:hypothetical protein
MVKDLKTRTTELSAAKPFHLNKLKSLSHMYDLFEICCLVFHQTILLKMPQNYNKI